MNGDRPEVQTYEKWLTQKFGYHRGVTEGYYQTLVAELRRTFETGVFWRTLLSRVEAFNIEYADRVGYPLFMNLKIPPELKTKPFKSFIEKTFRLNARNSREKWDREPRDGWILPTKYDVRVNDVVRTHFVVKYLDGAIFLRKKIEEVAREHGIRCEHRNEARFEGGYYAVHAYVFPVLEAPAFRGGTERVERSVEIQITTQLKEVIKELVHRYYEERRMRIGRGSDDWAWNFDGEEFAPNYVGHLLHYIEGVIMQIRNREDSHES